MPTASLTFLVWDICIALDQEVQAYGCESLNVSPLGFLIASRLLKDPRDIMEHKNSLSSPPIFYFYFSNVVVVSNPAKSPLCSQNNPRSSRSHCPRRPRTLMCLPIFLIVSFVIPTIPADMVVMIRGQLVPCVFVSCRGDSDDKHLRSVRTLQPSTVGRSHHGWPAYLPDCRVWDNRSQNAP
jgi:hypothetical protein